MALLMPMSISGQTLKLEKRFSGSTVSVGMRRERTSRAVPGQQVGYSRRSMGYRRCRRHHRNGYGVEVVEPGDPYEQTNTLRYCSGRTGSPDAAIEDVVQTRMYVTDIDDQERVGEPSSCSSATFVPWRRWSK